MDTSILQGRRILIVEDDYFAASELRAAFEECGCEILGPASEVGHALGLIKQKDAPDCAVLDINLNGELVFPVARELSQRGVPFVFATGYDSTIVPGEFRDAPQYKKPVDTDRILTTLCARVGVSRQAKPAAVEPASRTVNRLLRALPPSDYAAIAPMLRPVELMKGDLILKEGEIIPAVYFPETAVASVTVGQPDARPIEVAMVGREGMTDLVLRRGDRATLRSTVLLPGAALRMEAADFMQAMERPAVNQMVLAYKEALGLQFAYAALSHGTATIDARLARWILMLHDRVDGDTLAVVHNTIADLLAVRRSGVTTALHVLEGMGAIKSVRAQIIVKNRAILEQVAASTFGLAEAEYESLISRMPPPDLVN